LTRSNTLASQDARTDIGNLAIKLAFKPNSCDGWILGARTPGLRKWLGDLPTITDLRLALCQRHRAFIVFAVQALALLAAVHCCLETLAIFLQTFRLLAMTTRRMLRSSIVSCNLCLESVRVFIEGSFDCLVTHCFVRFIVVAVSAVTAITIHFHGKTVTVKFQALRILAIARLPLLALRTFLAISPTSIFVA
jgi:hypothetical protein